MNTAPILLSTINLSRRFLIRQVGAFLFLMVGIMTSSTVLASGVAVAPAEVLARWADARLVGTSRLTFLGLPVYDATLWAPPAGAAELMALSQASSVAYSQQPFALVLTYARKLEGALIAERSVLEMKRLQAFLKKDAERWEAFMKQAFPNVLKGDRLTGFSDGQGHTQFFYNGTSFAEREDADFAHLFFGIWLHQKTSQPKMRAELLGLKK